LPEHKKNKKVESEALGPRPEVKHEEKEEKRNILSNRIASEGKSSNPLSTIVMLEALGLSKESKSVRSL
jgi:hypothetical protein